MIRELLQEIWFQFSMGCGGSFIVVAYIVLSLIIGVACLVAKLFGVKISSDLDE